MTPTHSVRTSMLGLAIGFLLAAPVLALPGDPTALTTREQKRVRALQEERARLDDTVWRDEVRAQRHEQPVVDLWDTLRSAADPFATAAAFPFATLSPPATPAYRNGDGGLRIFDPLGPGAALTHAQWETLMAHAKQAGWKLAQEEFHHAEFKWNDGRPTSVFRINLHLIAPDGARVEWRGPVKIGWTQVPEDATPVIESIDASGLMRVERSGPPGFETIPAGLWERGRIVMPGELIAADLDGDGKTDLAVTGLNLLLRNTGGTAFSGSRLVRDPANPMLCAVLADVTGDGRPDLVVAGGMPLPTLHLYKALPSGGFSPKPVPLTADSLDLSKPMVITAGDVDGDGDTDLMLGQYKNPYVLGQLPDPYDNANDGFPCYLLKNDGTGRFTDATKTAGFDAKRNRRVYGASLLDLDGDGDLDFAVACDFAGLDVWMNDGKGRFTDATTTAVDDPMSFGMSLVADDFDGDGNTDLYMTGMGSTTMRRLQGMGLTNPARPDIALTRTRMGYGNRMYINHGHGIFSQPNWRDQVARSGWSWGAVSADFDRDGDRDLYITNGNLTGKSAADYCTTFWCHDLYTPTKGQERVAKALHLNSMQGLLRGEASWNGFEKNRLFLNTGAGFVEGGWPLDVAIEDDSHQLVTADFDNDGRSDLALIYEDRSDPSRPLHSRFGLRILMNRIQNANHWIGIRLKPKPGTSPFGAQISVTAGGKTRTAVIVCGDSWASQNPNEKIFGLGSTGTVDSIEVRWPGGQISRIPNPAPDGYLTVE